MNQSGRRYLALCAIAKDETPFIREWVAYHHLIGFEKIFIYDNESKVPVRDVVSDFYDVHIVDSYTIPGKAMQLTAYDHCLKTHGPDFIWMAFLDLDEFLVLADEPDLRLLLADYEAFGGLAVNMRTYGSSGHLKRPEGLVIENYLEHSAANTTIKSIVQPDKVEMAFTPHNFVYKQGAYAVNSDGLPAFGAYVPTATDKIWLNHYSFRSQQDYEEKQSKGDAVFGDDNPRSLEKFILQTKWPVTTCSEIVRHAPRIKKMLEERKYWQYVSVDSLPVLAGPYPHVASIAAQYLEQDAPDCARLVLLMAYARLKDEARFLSLAVRLLIRSKDFIHAKLWTRQLLAFSPETGSYLLYLEVLKASGEHEEAGRIVRYLRSVARITGDAALDEKVAALIQEQVP